MAGNLDSSVSELLTWRLLAAHLPFRYASAPPDARWHRALCQSPRPMVVAMMDRALRFTDSWGLTWWVYEELVTTSHSMPRGAPCTTRWGARLCFATDMVIRYLEPCPTEWWTRAPENLEELCDDAVPGLYHGLSVRGEGSLAENGRYTASESQAPWLGELVTP